VTRSHAQRLERVRQRLVQEGLAAIVALGKADCLYLTGFTGEAASVCVTAGELVLFTDPRFTVQAEHEASIARLEIFTEGRDDLLPGVLDDLLPSENRGGQVVGIDPTYLTVKRWDNLRPLLEQAGVQWKLVGDVVESCRQVKFPDELQAMRASANLVTTAFEYLESSRVIGRTELDVALDVEMFLRKNGSEGVAFPFIVATGARGAMPHAEASDTMIKAGQLIVFDLGTVVGGYASDVTRTYATGPIDDELRKAYQLVQEAQWAAVSAAKAGVSCKDLDAVARDHLGAGGLADRFVHSLGHGVGLEVHEAPNVSLRSEAVLEAGMVVTIEPGVYFPDRGGIRIEDSVVITDDGAEILTNWPRELRFLS
jgi:Xaa-Pro aminopeptidase